MKLNKIGLSAAMAVTFAYAEESSSTTMAHYADGVGVSANVNLTSNYVWRGLTLTDDSPAVQGGMDLDYKGLYAGVWASNLLLEGTNASLETDVYAGYEGSIDNFSYDIGYIQYIIFNESTGGFGEIYGEVGYDFKVLSIAYEYMFEVKTHDFEQGDNMLFSTNIPMGKAFSLDASYGMYENTNDYYYVGVNAAWGKFDWIAAYTGALDPSYGHDDNLDEDGHFVVTVGTSF